MCRRCRFSLGSGHNEESGAGLGGLATRGDLGDSSDVFSVQLLLPRLASLVIINSFITLSLLPTL
jgi:hypothetical protein